MSSTSSNSNATTVHDVLIVGAGLTGLTLAHTIYNSSKQQQQQQEKKPSVLVLEARDRLGGRISTIEAPESKAPVEVGATWVFSSFNILYKLSKSIGVELMEQFATGETAFEGPRGPQWQDDDGDNGQYRIKGGTSMLLTALKRELAAEAPNFKLQLDTPVASITRIPSSGVTEVRTSTGEVFKAKKVVTTIPPQLLAHTVTFSPALPDDFTSVARDTSTWMGDAMKGIVTYRTPFWRKKGKSGSLYSHEGPFIQMLDQCSPDGKKYALAGFMNPAAFSQSSSPPADVHMNSVDPKIKAAARANYEMRRSAVIAQLVKVFGKDAEEPLEYMDCYWKQEKYTMAPADVKARNEKAWGHRSSSMFRGRQHNFGHSVYRRTDLHGGSLFVGGTETAPSAAGFMEGAVISGMTIAKTLGY